MRKRILALRLGVAALSGVSVYLSYAPIGWWPAAIVGMALFYLCLAPQVTVRVGALLGFVHGLSLYLFLLPWIGEFVGNLPYVALAVTEALYSIAVGAGGAVLMKRRMHWAFPLWFVSVEWLRSTWPFGGFAWGRIAWGQVGGPLQYLAPYGGPALVSVATLACATGLALCLLRPRLLGAALLVVPLALGGAASISRGGGEVGQVTVAAIQGNVPRLGLDFNEQRRAVLSNHVKQTEALNQQVDLVVWPENASDVNPFADAGAMNMIDQAVQSAHAPILVGTLTRDDVGPRNTMVVFDPETGQGEYHHKKYLQPFGEYMPYRSFFRLFSSYVDMAGNFQPGDGTGVVHMKGIPVGVSTCYEVAFDAAGRDAVHNGAQILTVPTNNATFGFTDMTYQQLAMSRMRALELDRAVVIAATSGVSAIVLPSGEVTQKTSIFTNGTLVETLPLKDSSTFAARAGKYVEHVLSIMGVLFLIAALWKRRSAQGD